MVEQATPLSRLSNKPEVNLKSLFLAAFVALGALTQQACITHDTMEDYPQYLKNNEGELKLPHSDFELSYSLDDAAEAHKEGVRSFAAGLANEWMIEFGKMFRATMASKDVVDAFKGINTKGQGLIQIKVKLNSYVFGSHMAKISFDVTLVNASTNKTFTRTYKSEGKSQGGKMFWAGAFGMKNAIQQSTKLAMDKILIELVNDIRSIATPDSPNT